MILVSKTNSERDLLGDIGDQEDIHRGCLWMPIPMQNRKDENLEGCLRN